MKQNENYLFKEKSEVLIPVLVLRDGVILLIDNALLIVKCSVLLVSQHSMHLTEHLLACTRTFCIAQYEATIDQPWKAAILAEKYFIHYKDTTKMNKRNLINHTT